MAAWHCLIVLIAPLLAAPVNLAGEATLTASSQASADKYGAPRAADGDVATHWASADRAPLPQIVTLVWPAPVTFDTVAIDPFALEDPNLYGQVTEVELVAGETVLRRALGADEDMFWLFRFPAPQTVTRLEIRLLAVLTPTHYVGLDEIGAYLDPNREITPPQSVPKPKAREVLNATGRDRHPTVYLTAADLARGRRNAAETSWGKRIADGIRAAANKWFARNEEQWAAFLPPPGACYAYGFTGSPANGAKWGTWGGARCDWDLPGKVQTGDGQILPNEQYPDSGAGYHAPDGRVHYFVGSWNAWVTEQWQHAVRDLAYAYALTDEERYADRAAFFLDLLASIYPESSAGSWDYPSSPPSGRFARPWYQVARTLTPLVEAYDLIYQSDTFARASRRPSIAASWPAGPTLQMREVGTVDRQGFTEAGMTRRENIDRNLIGDGAYYCYEHTFGGALHNGHADYMRGALAAGALLGIREYVHNAVESPYSIWAMVANNCDRDGRYYETSLGYALHARDLYLTFVAPLKNWRDERYPNGVDLLADPRFRTFYQLPAATLDCAGHVPNYGDTGPDNNQTFPTGVPFDRTDYNFAEELYGGLDGPARDEFADVLRWLARGDVSRLRDRNATAWMLFHADPVPDGPNELPEALQRKVYGSWFLGQKGLALLRDGEGADAQAALLRFGPSLNHGHTDDLGLIYYANGWQNTYEIGYGLGSTHTQVGWGRQTASHTIVSVDEKPQSGPASGGSLYLFGRLPGFQVIEADSPGSYGQVGVTEYRRTVALVGEGAQQVLVDLFRVAGGSQHDYRIGSQKQDFTVAGVDLGPEEDGSLAGPDIAWGEKQGIDGDLIGFPNKPYWNPPPGNGYGFFYDLRRGRTARPWTMDWTLGGLNDAHFRAHLLPTTNDEAIVAKAPGLYPHHQKASYAIWRRRGEAGLTSSFASVMEPYAKPIEPGTWSAEQMEAMVVAADRDYRVGSGYGNYLFFRGEAPGDGYEMELEVPEAGRYELSLDALHYPSYATIQVSVDDQPIGEPQDLSAAEAAPMQPHELGEVELTAGTHRVRFEVMPGERTIFGLQGFRLRPAGQPFDPALRPVLEQVTRLAATGEQDPVAIHLRRRGGRDEFVLRAAAGVTAKATTPIGEIEWRGGVACLAYEGTQPVAASLVGCAGVRAPGLILTPATAGYQGTVTTLDENALTVDLNTPLPAAGLEGEAVLFSRPEWSRTSGYRLSRLEPIAGGSRLHFGDQSFLLGQGRVMEIRDATTIASDIPHDYTRSVVGQTTTEFFDGKILTTAGGARTRIASFTFGQPTVIQVAETSVLKENDILYYHDLEPGATARIPTSLALRRGPTGWVATSTVEAVLDLGAGAFAVPLTGAETSQPVR